MEVYILDDLFRRDTVVDRFQSLIWTERWQSWGDFELVINSTYENRNRFVGGVKLAINESYRVMTVETVEKNTDADGKALLTIKGREFVTILDDRAAIDTLNSLMVTDPKWVLVGTPGAVARAMFDHVVRDVALSPYDAIPFLQTGTIFPEDTLFENNTSLRWEQKPDTLYNAVKGICDLYDMGFRLVRNFDSSQLYFDIYTGSNRTTGQTILNPVVFAPELDNLQNTTEYRTITDTKNCAYVYSSQGTAIVYPVGTDPEVAGFDKRTMLVPVDDLDGTPTPDAIQTYLVQKGFEALSEHRTLTAFDGEHSQSSQYRYGIDYNLGDLVEMRNSDGLANEMRVTEQIFVDDNEGERSYPTLSLYEFVEPGTWLSWDYNQVWIDLASDMTAWGDLTN